MEINGVKVCDTLERLDRCISEGLYDATLDLSPHLGYVCPHLKVTDRDLAAGGDAGIRIHIANFVSQLEGCVAVGTKDPDCELDNSAMAFHQMMALLPPSFKVLVYAQHS